MNDRKQFIAAVFLAALFGIERFGFASCVGALWNIGRALAARRGKVAKDIYDARMSCCESCPIYFSKTNSCGSPLADDPSLGCFCYQPIKASQPDATCWADENLDIEEIGWKTINQPQPDQSPSTPLTPTQSPLQK